MTLRTIDDIINSIPKPTAQVCSVPSFQPNTTKQNRVAFAVASMKDHTSDEGWQLMQGLEDVGYTLYGAHLPNPQVEVRAILRREPNLGTLVVQDKKEWASTSKTFKDKTAEFKHIGVLAHYPEIFKLTVLRDAHYNPPFHQEAANEMGCHAWIVPYNPKIVNRLAPYTRPEHLVRTYHSVDPLLVPEYTHKGRKQAILSGAINQRVYPLRTMLASRHNNTPSIDYLRHPGYHRRGTNTPDYLKLLSRYKVAICTSSIFGYSLRKIMEATACGCVVITDLPTDEVLPEIDDNLCRVSSGASIREIVGYVHNLCNNYDPALQEYYAQRCLGFYNYQNIACELDQAITDLRANYIGAKL